MSIPTRETTTTTSTGQMPMGPEQFHPLSGKQFDQPTGGQFGQQMGGQFDQPSMGGQFGQQPLAGQFEKPSMMGGQQIPIGGQQQMGGQFEQPSGGQFGQQQMGGQFEQPSGGQFGQQQMGGQFEQPSGEQFGQFEKPSLGGQPSIEQPLQTAPLQSFQAAPLESLAPLQQGREDISLMLPSGQELRYQLPQGGAAAIPGARVKEWTLVENVPLTNISVPPGFKVVQYERDIEVDLGNLTPAPLLVPTTYPVTEVCTPITCKPEIRVETSTIPPTQLDTRTKEFPGGEEVISTGPHGEKIKTVVTQLPGGGERIETKVKEPLSTGITQREDIKTTTTIRECGPLGGTTIVESHSHLVPPSRELVQPGQPGYGAQQGAQGVGHHHASDLQEGVGRKTKHHEGLLGSLKGAFSRKSAEVVPPKETL